ncbi:MAG: beta-ketoacyl-[acyl-carrier-protein] synthase II [Lentisphaerae bacterium]|jgi:3-oxoacyl-[acyl-carrier-protein] synthase II|nr:beta-ketoacyl-[acyl-carrier-protein] synthase II [Lentisphaerota bacterium]
MKKVMITGIGMITAVGNGKSATWESVKAGKPGITKITKFDPSRCTCQVAAEVKGFEEYAIGGGLLDRKAARKMANFSQYAVAAAVEAWKDAGYTAENKPDMDRVGTILGVGIGGLEVTSEAFRTLFEKGPDRLSPLAIPELISNEGAGNIAIALGAKGPCQVVTTACASSTDALGFALDLIRAGRADVVIAGGAEATIMEFCVGGFMKEKALATKFNDTPEKACRPFNVDRDGFVMGEGSAILILESEEHAKARGASVYAELAGYGATCDAYHITAPDPSADGAVKAIEIALANAEVTDKTTVDYINAHGTSTHLNDAMETTAFKRVFGDEQAKKINISSTKPFHGHCLGATGAIEAAITALAIKEGYCPATINYENPDPELDLNYTPNVGVKRDIRVAISSSLGFGGHNGILVFKKA